MDPLGIFLTLADFFAGVACICVGAYPLAILIWLLGAWTLVNTI